MKKKIYTAAHIKDNDIDMKGTRNNEARRGGGNALTGSADARRTDLTATLVAVPHSDTATADMTGAETRRVNALGPVVLLRV